MKKIFRMLLATALFAGVVGCSADRTEDVVLPTLTDTEDFTAVLADESRTELGADNSVLWSATDKISIFRKTVLNREYAVKAGAGTTEATFKYVAYHGSDFTKTANAVNYGVYPFAAANALSTAGVATVTIPAEQEYTPGEALLNNSVMVGKSETTTIAFKNTESMVRFRLFSEIPGDFSIRKIRLESLSGKLLNGEATVDIEAADPVLTVTSGTSALTVNVEETVLTDVETVVYAVLPATAFAANDLKITFTAYNNLDAVEGTFEVTLPSALTLERGQITTLKYTFRAEEFKGTTESWGELTWDGTSLKSVDPVGDVYTINTGAELAWVAAMVNGTVSSGASTLSTRAETSSAYNFSGKTIKLGHDIDLGGNEWTPIGVGTNRFSGTIDGDGHAIRNYTISQRHGDYPQAALVGNTSLTVAFRNLTLEGVSIEYPDNEKDFYAAALLATTYGHVTIENVTVKNSYLSGRNKVGTLIAHDGGSSSILIDNCHALNVKFEATDKKDGGSVGGLIGFMTSYANTGQAAPYGEYYVKNSTVKNCEFNVVNSLNIGKRANAQLIGSIQSKAGAVQSIEDCQVEGNVWNEKFYMDTDGDDFGDTEVAEEDRYPSLAGNLIGGDRNETPKGTVIVNGAEIITSTTALADKVTEPGAEVIVPAGTYTFPTTWGEGVKMICSEDTVFEGTSSLNIKGATVVNATFENTSGTAASGTVNGTFQNCSFIGGSNGLRWCYAGDTAVFENCTIYGEVYGIHFDGGANEVIMRNCDVTGWSSFGGAVNQVTIEECRFHKSGYGRLRFYQDATVTDTTFDADFQGIDCGDGGAGFGGLTLTLNGCTYAGGVMSDLANITDKDVWMIDGTQALPANVVVVSSAAALAEVATAIAAGETYEGKVLRLTSDVTLSGEFTPIAAGVRSGNQAVGTGFKGTFDGQGKTISGLTITSSGESDAIGFFGIVDGGEVKNVNFTNVNIDVTSKNAGTAVGLLVNGGKVSGVTVSGSVKGYQGLGGVVGRILSNGTIENCTNNATITSTGYNVGGIVGAAYYTVEGAEMTISGCVNKGEVNCGTNGAGGIVGLSAANVVDCENTANVTGKGTSVGGLVGEQQNAGSVKNSINRGDVKNNAVAYGTGGVIGWVRYNGAVADYPRKEAIEVIGNTNYGRVTGGNDAGGIVGTLYGLGYVNQNENYAQELSGSAFAAGIVANAQFTEPLLGMTESYYVEVNNNLSTTTLDQMTGNCKALYVYDNNQGACLTQTGNRQN